MKANLMTKKIEMTKSEAKEAGKLNTEKFHELRQYMAIYPGYEIQIVAPAKRKVELRGLDYKYMRTYILSHDDDQHSKMEKFKTLIAQDMFYAWIFGFGRRAKIIDPPYVADKMREYCQKIAEMYEPK